MKIKDLAECSIDFSELSNYSSILDWINEDVSRAFYLGLLESDLMEFVDDLNSSESGIQLLKSVIMLGNSAKPYTKTISKMLHPYLTDKDGVVFLDMVDHVINEIQLEKEEDIYGIAYTLGRYVNYLISTHE